jgi:3-phosphoshikimate 1-carboxyvinyltransferase
MPNLELKSVQRAVGEVTLPGSKSLSNRALHLASLAQGTTHLRNLSAGDDVTRMRIALDALGVTLRMSNAGTQADVVGQGGRLQTGGRDYRLDLGNAGTAFRPLTAALCLSDGNFELDGEPRMRERPIGHLVSALTALGARISYMEAPGYPPVRIEGGALLGDGGDSWPDK